MAPPRAPILDAPGFSYYTKPFPRASTCRPAVDEGLLGQPGVPPSVNVPASALLHTWTIRLLETLDARGLRDNTIIICGETAHALRG